MTVYEKTNMSLREDMQIIYDMIPPSRRVLDLGCGNGDLLAKLIAEKKIIGQGIEMAHQGVYSCIEKGVPVIQANLNQGLGDFPNKSFDYIVLSQTLQLLQQPDELLKEMLRVGKVGIVSINNFGYWPIRLHLFFKGRLPTNQSVFTTSNKNSYVQILTIKDFIFFVNNLGKNIIEQKHLPIHRSFKMLKNILPSSFSSLAIFKITS